MFRHFSLLLLFGLVSHNGNTEIPVSGKKGGNITLTCEFEANKIFHIDLISESGDIDVCQTEDCSGRVFKNATCDVIIRNLRFSDAGKYTLRVHFNNDQTNVAQQKERMYQLHIHDDISGKAGRPLKMHVLMFSADKVETNSSGEWKEVWKRGHRVQSDRMNVSDENLIIKAFTDNDAGTYRVLDSGGEILITVTVTESGTESGTESDTDSGTESDTESGTESDTESGTESDTESDTESGTESDTESDTESGTESDTESTGKLDTDKDKTDDTEEHTVEKWILPVGVCSGILAVIVIAVVIWRCRLTGYTQAPVQENPEHPEIPLNNLN